MNKQIEQYSQYLIHYGLIQEQIDVLGDSLPKNTILYDATGCYTDIVGLAPLLAVVINPTAMPENDLEEMLDFYKEVSWNISYPVIFTKKIAAPKQARITYLDDRDFNSERVHALLSKAKARRKRNASYHARIALSLLVLRMIRNRPGISTKNIAEECEISEKTALRYIETLCVSGEWIDYDHQARGWKWLPWADSLISGEW